VQNSDFVTAYRYSVLEIDEWRIAEGGVGYLEVTFGYLRHFKFDLFTLHYISNSGNSSQLTEPPYTYCNSFQMELSVRLQQCGEDFNDTACSRNFFRDS